MLLSCQALLLLWLVLAGAGCCRLLQLWLLQLLPLKLMRLLPLLPLHLLLCLWGLLLVLLLLVLILVLMLMLALLLLLVLVVVLLLLGLLRLSPKESVVMSSSSWESSFCISPTIR